MAPLQGEEPMASSQNLQVVSIGEMMVDFLPEVPGISLAESCSFVKDAGGAPANVAVAISKLGGSSAFIGKFGDDEFGHMLIGVLKRHGVNVDGCHFDAHARTGLAFLTFNLTAGVPREFMFYRNPSADMLLTAAELDMGLIGRAKVFHFGSVSLAAEPCRSACLAAMRTAKAAGTLCSYDPNVRPTLWPSEDAARSAILGVWKEADLIKVSDEEVAFLTKGDPYDEENVLSLWFEGLKLLVVTDGDKGCRYFTEFFKGSVPGFKVSTVDTTGAGDAFVGCLLFNVAKDDSICLNEEKLRQVLRFCNACGAICTTQMGPVSALPTTAAALELVNRGY